MNHHQYPPNVSRGSAAARRLINADALVQSIQENILCLTMNSKPVYTLPSAVVAPGQVTEFANTVPGVVWQEMTEEDVRRYNIILSQQFKLLSKVLPDLKAIEVDDQRDVERLDVATLAQRLKGLEAMREQAQKDIAPKTLKPVTGEIIQ